MHYQRIELFVYSVYADLNYLFVALSYFLYDLGMSGRWPSTYGGQNCESFLTKSFQSLLLSRVHLSNFQLLPEPQMHLRRQFPIYVAKCLMELNRHIPEVWETRTNRKFV